MAGPEEDVQTRTDLAASRTVLAVERTFNSWVKTSIGFLAGGLGLAKLMSASIGLSGSHGLLILIASSLLIVVAIVISAYATHRYRQRMDELGRAALGRWPTGVIIFIGASFMIVCLVSLACLWMLE